jgi:hypothetical protein
MIGIRPEEKRRRRRRHSVIISVFSIVISLVSIALSLFGRACVADAQNSTVLVLIELQRAKAAAR